MRKIVSLILVLIISSVTVFSVRADELTDAQKNLNNIKDSISDNKDQLNSINEKKESTEKSLNELEEKMKTSSANLNQLNGKISDLNAQIGELEKQISNNNANLKEQNELFKKRMRAIYINGNESYLDLLINASSFSEFFNRVDYITKVMEHDKNLMKSIETNKKALEIERSEIEKKKKETAGLKQQADNNLKELQSASDTKKSLMASLEKDKTAYEKLIKEEEDQSAAIAAMIKQIQKKREEDKKKQQQQNNNNNNSKPNGGNNVLTGNSSSIGKLYCVTGKPYPITSPYGWRVHPVLGTKRFHAGMDIGVFSGTPIYALADGEVIYSGWMSGYGNVIMIDHGSLTSVYAHNSSLVGKVGQTVKGGQLISYSGNTGLSSGPHLHFEIRKENGETIEPSPYYVR